MAADAGGRRPLVDVVLVARRARHRRVHADQLEEAVVVEAGAASPGRVARPVAAVARGREAGGGVVGARRAVVIGAVTAHAVGRGALVDVVPMTRGAGLGGVRAHEREVRVVVEGRLLEGRVRRAMARLARRGEPRGGVIRLRRRLVVLHVARRAVDARRAEVAVAVAGVAGEQRVLGAQAHAGLRGVIPARRQPAGRGVARLALGAEPRLVAVVPAADPVAVEARGGRALEHPVQVARLAGHRLVPAVQREAARLVERAARRLPLRAHRGREDEQRDGPGGGEQPEASHGVVLSAGASGLWHVMQSLPIAPWCGSV